MKKKILILGGASVHCKLVAAAKSLGYHTIVTDYLSGSPAKMMADEAWTIDVTSVDEIVGRCKEEGVDGVISGWLDPCQKPYAEICFKLGLPCYAGRDQVFELTNKRAFKNLCTENGVDIVPEYSCEDVLIGAVEYPVFVKPVDSRGSRGQTICNSSGELSSAIDFAKAESSDGDVIIERYVGNTLSFQVTYFFIEGEAYVVRTADGYKGNVEEQLDKVALCSVSPSIYTDIFMREANENVIRMLKKLGIKNGPVMLQGFYNHGAFRFYDPGLRFPGVDCELIYKKIFGIDFMKMMAAFAATGAMPKTDINHELVYLDGKKAAVLFPTIAAGQISRIRGLDKVKNRPEVASVSCRYKAGDVVAWTYDVRQRLGEIDLYSDTYLELAKSIRQIQEDIAVYDSHGNDMIYKPFNTDRIPDHI